MLDPELRALLAQFEVGAVAEKSVLRSPRDDLRRGWRVALDRAAREGVRTTDATTSWIRSELRNLAEHDATDEMRALAAEVEAALRLSWIGPVARVAEAQRQATADFQLGALNVEVYCPQEHVAERRVVEALLASEIQRATGPVKIAIVRSSPTTGSGRSVGKDGLVVRDPRNQARTFPANKLIDRILSDKKRAGAQLCAGELNLLWLDLKHGLGLTAIDCIPLRSAVAKGMCFVGSHGVWHAFYGRIGDPLFVERTVLDFPGPRHAYPQQRHGWFREMPKASCAILSVLDGIILLSNPWAAVPLDAATTESLMTLSEVRPEFCWFDELAPTLVMRVEAERSRISSLASRGSSKTVDEPT